MSKELSIIIPAAGMGRRMKSYRPKPLIELSDNYTVIGWQTRVLRKRYPKAQLIVVVGHEADSVAKNLDSKIVCVENELYETTNVVRSIGMGLRAAIHPNVLIVYGDLVFNEEAIQIVGDSSMTLVDSTNQFNEEEVGVTIVNGRVTQMSYDLPNKWGQVIYLTGKELKLFKDFAWNRDCSRWYGFEVVNAILRGGGTIKAVEPHNMKIAEIDSSKDIEKAKFLLKEVGNHLNLGYNVV